MPASAEASMRAAIADVEGSDLARVMMVTLDSPRWILGGCTLDLRAKSHKERKDIRRNAGPFSESSP